MEDYGQLLKLISDHCTADQVKDLLRTAIGNKNVKVSAATKEDLIAKNLREALDSHSIDVEKVYDLLREAEENGPQHIFYLRCPSRDVAQLLTFEYVHKQLVGGLPTAAPRLDLKPNDYVVVDVRRWNEKKPLDWAVKFYGHETREEATGEVIVESESRILKVFEKKEFRYVLMARWNAPDIFELRVPSNASVLRIDKWRKILEERLKPVIPFDRFKPWVLKGISKTLFDEQAKNKNKYRLGDAQLEDADHNYVTFQSYVAEADLFGTAATQSAAKGLLEHDATYKHQRVFWLEQADVGVTGEISCLIGARAEHEVIFSRHQNSRGIDYATAQLRAFSKR